MDAIRWEGNIPYLLDQTKLPVIEVWLPYTDYRPMVDAIRTMAVRGVPAVGVTAAYVYYLTALADEGLDEAKETLAVSRPTATDLFRALERMERKAEECGGATEPLITEAKATHAGDVAMCWTMGARGTAMIPGHVRTLAHCNAGALATGGYGTTLGVIRAAHRADKVNVVYCDETRPFLQGVRLTAYELVSDHTPATLVANNIAASLVAKGKINSAIVGYDRTVVNGDFVNKIGTYSVAVNAHYHGTPFHMALPCSTINLSLASGSGIPIEERDRDEVRTLYGTYTAPESVEVCDPAFDVTPHSLITSVVTEKGVIYPPFQENPQKLPG